MIRHEQGLGGMRPLKFSCRRLLFLEWLCLKAFLNDEKHFFVAVCRGETVFLIYEKLLDVPRDIYMVIEGTIDFGLGSFGALVLPQ